MVREMATHSSILAWEIPWTEEPGGYSLWGCKELDTTWQEWMKKKNGDFPGGSSGWDSILPMQGAQVWSLVEELGSRMLNQEFTCHNK